MGRDVDERGVLARSGRRVAVTVVGGTVTGVGVVMFFLPPLPGIATTIAGLALLSTEYDGAARWLERARARFRRADPDGTDPSAEGTRPEGPTGPQ